MEATHNTPNKPKNWLSKGIDAITGAVKDTLGSLSKSTHAAVFAALVGTTAVACDPSQMTDNDVSGDTLTSPDDDATEGTDEPPRKLATKTSELKDTHPKIDIEGTSYEYVKAPEQVSDAQLVHLKDKDYLLTTGFVENAFVLMPLDSVDDSSTYITLPETATLHTPAMLGNTLFAITVKGLVSFDIIEGENTPLITSNPQLVSDKNTAFIGAIGMIPCEKDQKLYINVAGSSTAVETFDTTNQKIDLTKISGMPSPDFKTSKIRLTGPETFMFWGYSKATGEYHAYSGTLSQGPDGKPSITATLETDYTDFAQAVSGNPTISEEFAGSQRIVHDTQGNVFVFTPTSPDPVDGGNYPDTNAADGGQTAPDADTPLDVQQVDAGAWQDINTWPEDVAEDANNPGNTDADAPNDSKVPTDAGSGTPEDSKVPTDAGSGTPEDSKVSTDEGSGTPGDSATSTDSSTVAPDAEPDNKPVEADHVEPTPKPDQGKPSDEGKKGQLTAEADDETATGCATGPGAPTGTAPIVLATAALAALAMTRRKEDDEADKTQ